MEAFALVMLGFAPGVFWLWLIYQRDRYIPAPVYLVVRTFLWGMAVSVPVVVVETLLLVVGGFGLGTDPAEGRLALHEAAFTSFVVAGMTEELAKYLVLRKTIQSSPYFRQPLDGIIFSAAAALGFASIENVGYMFSFGAAVILSRGPFTTVAHVLFASVFGYSTGARKIGKVRSYVVPLSVLLAMGLHGLFDFLLLSDPPRWPLAIGLFLAMGVLFLGMLKLAQRQSPYRGKVAAILVTCPKCAHRSGYGASFCTACGQSLALARTGPVFLCGQCNSLAERHHQFCTSCGSRLDRKLVSASS